MTKWEIAIELMKVWLFIFGPIGLVSLLAWIGILVGWDFDEGGT